MPRQREGGVRTSEAALTQDGRSGQAGGQVAKIKGIQRQMYGQAKRKLLGKRVLLAS